MTIKFTNNATSTLASGINDSVTSMSVAGGQGGLFPTLSGADVFYVTLSNTSGANEIVKVTVRSTDTFTIVRAQDSTSALSWNTGDKVELRATAAGLAAMAQTANNLSDLANASTARTNLGLVAIAASGSASDLSSGTVGTARLGSGTASSSTYLRGDQTWAAIAGFPTGTAMLFVQTAAPTGWTKSTTHDNKALRVVSGTASSGGSVAFTTAFASGLSAGATTLSTAQMPSHAHTFTYQGGGGGATGLNASVTFIESGTFTTNAQGGGGSHTHTMPSFAVSYVDTIIATKD
jgi:hypothetical protein